MKKWLNIFLAIIMVLALVMLSGCHEKYDLEQLAKEDAEKNPETYETEPVDIDIDELLAEDEAAAENQGSEPVQAEEEEPEEVTPPPATILGNRTETSYSNSYFGIKFNAPTDAWYIADEEELAQVMGFSSTSVDDEEILELLQSSGYVMDLYALDTSLGIESTNFDNINITIEDIGKLYGVLLSEQELAESSLATTKQALEAQGWSNVDLEVTEEVFAGSPRVCIECSAEKGSTSIFQKQIYIKKETYIACITVGSFGEDRTDSLLASFGAL